MSRDKAFLQDIAQAVERIKTYLAGVDKARFDSDLMLQDAVIRNLEVIGEAVKLLSDEIKNKRTEIPWQSIARMRDKLIHRYFSVDVDIVWQTAIGDLKDLQQCVAELLREMTE